MLLEWTEWSVHTGCGNPCIKTAEQQPASQLAAEAHWPLGHLPCWAASATPHPSQPRPAPCTSVAPVGPRRQWQALGRAVSWGGQLSAARLLHGGESHCPGLQGSRSRRRRRTPAAALARCSLLTLAPGLTASLDVSMTTGRPNSRPEGSLVGAARGAGRWVGQHMAGGGPCLDECV